MKALLRIVVAVGWLASFASFANAQTGSTVRFGFGGGVVLWHLNQMPEGQLVSLPLALRQVPGHKDDFSNPPLLTIPGNTVQPDTFTLMGSLSIAPEIMFANRVSIRGGMMFDFNFDGAIKNSRDNTQEVNLHGGTERGVGESLVYYAVLTQVKKFEPYAEIEGKIYGPVWLLVGAKRLSWDYVDERGYDRYDSLETQSTTSLTTVESTPVYGGIDFRFFDDDNLSASFLLLGGIATNSVTTIVPLSLAIQVSPRHSSFAGVKLTFSVFTK